MLVTIKLDQTDIYAALLMYLAQRNVDVESWPDDTDLNLRRNGDGFILEATTSEGAEG